MTTVRELMEQMAEASDPADIAAGMIEKPDNMLGLLRWHMDKLEKGLTMAQKQLKGHRKAGAGATVAVDLLREHVARQTQAFADVAVRVNESVQKAIR